MGNSFSCLLINSLFFFLTNCKCGDGAPSSKKGLYSFHVNEIQAHFKGIHVHINARQDADIEPLSIMKKVKDSAGTKYVSTKMNYPVFYNSRLIKCNRRSIEFNL